MTTMNKQIQRFCRRNIWVFLVVILLFALLSLRVPGDRAVHDNTSRTIEQLYKRLEFQEPGFLIKTITTEAPVQEVQHIAFLKVHKSGSTTAQNIFLRYGWTHDLTFVLPPEKNRFGYPNIISLQQTLNENNTLPPPPSKTFDILCHHVIYDHDVFRKYLPNDTVYIGILREPFEQFKSVLNYIRPATVFKVKLDNGILPGTRYLQSPKRFENKKTPRNSFTNNRMSVEFGVSEKIIQNDDEKRIMDYIKLLDRDFQLVVIAEYFEESMILLKRILHWSHKDILYLDKNVATKKNESSFIGSFDRLRYKRWAKTDYALYNHFFLKLRQQIRAEGFDFDDELLHFTEIRRTTGEFCKQKPFLKNSTMVVHRNKWSHEFELTHMDCILLRRQEIEFTQAIRRKQYG